MTNSSVFSLEKGVFHERTREYFSEVANSYHNENYSSAIVGLYSVVVYDLLVKMKMLVEFYSDKNAERILNEVDRKRKGNQNSSKWEKNLIDLIYNCEALNIIDSADKVHLDNLYAIRNICAHPSLDKENELYRPNQETVASLIRNIYEGLLSKPPYLSDSVFPLIIESAKTHKRFLDEESFLRHIEQRFLSFLPVESRANVFQKAWKYVFTDYDKPELDVRWILFRLVEHVYDRNVQVCNQLVELSPDKFNVVNHDRFFQPYLIRFIMFREQFMEFLQQDVIHMLEAFARRNDKGRDYDLRAWFFSDSYFEHISYIKSNVGLNSSIEAIIDLLNVGLERGYKKDVVDFITWRYSESRSFDEANDIFKNLVIKYLDRFDGADLISFCEAINHPSQATNRGAAKEDHKLIFNRCVQILGSDFDVSIYPYVF